MLILADVPADPSLVFMELGAIVVGLAILARMLFMIGLEYVGEELYANLRTALPAGLVDFALNFTPGLGAGLLLGWRPLASVLTVLDGRAARQAHGRNSCRKRLAQVVPGV